MDTQTKALILGCYNCDVSQVKEAIANGADVDGMDVLGITPIMHVIGNTSRRITDDTRIQIIQLLLDAGADINRANKEH